MELHRAACVALLPACRVPYLNGCGTAGADSAVIPNVGLTHIHLLHAGGFQLKQASRDVREILQERPRPCFPWQHRQAMLPATVAAVKWQAWDMSPLHTKGHAEVAH